MHALIIEHEPFTVLMIEDALATVGYDSAESASSIAEATRMARERRPDLITSAVHLGEECGFEAVESACNGYYIPTVFVTSCSWKVRARDAQMAVVQKPFTAETLHAAVRAAT